MVQARGFAYKDVIQPFVVAHWLARHTWPVIRLRRNVADVAFSMLQRQWQYPARLFPNSACPELALVQGLLRAESALNSITTAKELDFDRFIFDERLLGSTLSSLYGSPLAHEPKYIDDEFERRREQILKRRKTSRFQELSEKVERARETAESGQANGDQPSAGA
jgi:hypothetical protein